VLLVTSFTNFVSPALATGWLRCSCDMSCSEKLAALWLLLKGVNVEQWRSTTAQRTTINPAARMTEPDAFSAAGLE